MCAYWKNFSGVFLSHFVPFSQWGMLKRFELSVSDTIVRLKGSNEDRKLFTLGKVSCFKTANTRGDQGLKIFSTKTYSNLNTNIVCVYELTRLA